MKKIPNQYLVILLKNLHRTIECGLNSGYPPCCVAFYVNGLLNFTARQHKNYRKKLRANPFGYIPCPDCLEKLNKVKGKVCPENECCNTQKYGYHVHELIGHEEYEGF